MWTPPHNYVGQRFSSNVYVTNGGGEDKKQEQQPTPIEHFFSMPIERKDKPAMWKNPNQICAQAPTQNENLCHYGQWSYCSREPFTYDVTHHYSTGHPNYFPVYNQEERECFTAPYKRESEQSEPYHSSISSIEWIHRTVIELIEQAQKFKGQPRDKEYLYLDEMLTRSLIKLDNIDTDGKESIRHARKEAITCIQKGISTLESRALANQDKPTIAEEKPLLKSLEVSGISRSGSQYTSSSYPIEVDNESLINITNFDGASITPSGSESNCSQSIKVIYMTSIQNNTSEENTIADVDTEVNESDFVESKEAYLTKSEDTLREQSEDVLKDQTNERVNVQTEDNLKEESEDSVKGEIKDTDKKVWKKMLCLVKRHLKL